MSEDLLHFESLPELLLVNLSVVPSHHSKLLLEPSQPLGISVQPAQAEGSDV